MIVGGQVRGRDYDVSQGSEGGRRERQFTSRKIEKRNLEA